MKKATAQCLVGEVEERGFNKLFGVDFLLAEFNKVRYDELGIVFHGALNLFSKQLIMRGKEKFLALSIQNELHAYSVSKYFLYPRS